MKKTKSLDGTEYELVEVLDMEDYIEKIDLKVHYPDRTIASFHSFGINTQVCVGYKKDSGLFYMTEIDDVPTLNLAQVTNITEDGDKIIIKAVKIKEDEKKVKFVNSVIDEIDFKQGLGNEVFVNLLSNVFTKERLQEILESDDIEILSFEGLMSLRLGDKAFRL